MEQCTLFGYVNKFYAFLCKSNQILLSIFQSRMFILSFNKNFINSILYNKCIIFLKKLLYVAKVEIR